MPHRPFLSLLFTAGDLGTMLVLASLLLCAPAARGATGSELVLHDPDLTQDQARALALGNPVEVLPVTGVFSKDGAIARLYRVAERVPCTVEARSTAQLTQDADACEENLLNLDMEAAAEAIGLARAGLVCATEQVPTELLSRIFFLDGLLGAYGGDEHRARRSFQQSLAVNPGRKWDATYPPVVYLQYLFALEQHYTGGKVILRRVGAQGESSKTWLDGRVMEQDESELAIGAHFLQIQGVDDEGDVHLTTFAFVLEEGQDAVLATDAGMADLLLQGTAVAPKVGPAVEALLLELAGTYGVSAVQIVSADRTVRFVPGSGLWSVLRKPLDRREKLHRTGGALAGVGFGSFVGGGVLVLATGTGRAPQTVDPGYQSFYRANVAGWVLMGAGTLLASIGIPVAVTHRSPKESVLKLSLGPSDGGFALQLHGRLP